MNATAETTQIQSGSTRIKRKLSAQRGGGYSSNGASTELLNITNDRRVETHPNQHAHNLIKQVSESRERSNSLGVRLKNISDPNLNTVRNGNYNSMIEMVAPATIDSANQFVGSNRDSMA